MDKMKVSLAIFMVGTFPPPTHGMAAVNAAVCDRLRSKTKDGEIFVVNTSANGLDRSIFARLSRLPSIVKGLAQLMTVRHHRGGALYIGVSGGSGQIYDVLFLLLARFLGMRVFVHHHSFAYLRSRKKLMMLLVRVAGQKAVHVTQCVKMQEELERLYAVRCAEAISNVVFLANPASVYGGQPRASLRSVGFLSNVAVEKGILIFLDLMEEMHKVRLPLRGEIAGPFQDSATEHLVRQRMSKLPNVEYVGPKYKQEKELFLNCIDVLIFPTIYVNETEGLVNLEAMRFAVPVIAYGRGCVPSIVNNNCGCVIPPGEPFLPYAIAQLQHWLNSPDVFRGASDAAARNYRGLQAEHMVRWERLEDKIIGVV